MTDISEELREAVARAIATEHYADRFDKPRGDEHVQMNVEANWQTWLIYADSIIRAVAPLIAAQEQERCIKALDDDMGHLIEGQALDGPYALQRAKAAIRASKEG